VRGSLVGASGGVIVTGSGHLWEGGVGAGAAPDSPSGMVMFNTPGAHTFEFPAGAGFAVVEVIGSTGSGGAGEVAGVGSGGGGGVASTTGAGVTPLMLRDGTTGGGAGFGFSGSGGHCPAIDGNLGGAGTFDESAAGSQGDNPGGGGGGGTAFSGGGAAGRPGQVRITWGP
jgi:hypothetical protein